MKERLKNTPKIASVTERDIELLLLEELQVSPEFRRWLVEKIGLTNNLIRLAGVWHRLPDPDFGETDILFVFENDLMRRVAILIKNDIARARQTQNAKKYKRKGEEGVKDGAWDSFVSCLVTVGNPVETKVKHFDHIIGYEDVIRWFQTAGLAERGSYKIGLIRQAVSQTVSEAKRDKDAHRKDFWDRYWHVCKENYPHFMLNPMGQTIGKEDFPVFHPADLGVEAKIIHKLTRGFVDLVIEGDPEAVEERYRPYLDREMLFVSAKTSGVVRLHTPIIQEPYDFEKDEAAVVLSLEKTERLHRLYQVVEGGQS